LSLWQHSRQITGDVEQDMTMDNNAQIVGNAGLYYACYRLSLLGWNAMPTSRNARGVDVIAYNYDCTQMISIQVKSLSKRNPVPLGNCLDRVMGDYWIVVNNLQKDPASFILLPSEIRTLAHRGEKDGKVSFWLQPTAYDKQTFREAWQRIGNPKKGGQSSTGADAR
jgi:hypothetical protein